MKRISRPVRAALFTGLPALIALVPSCGPGVNGELADMSAALPLMGVTSPTASKSSVSARLWAKLAATGTPPLGDKASAAGPAVMTFDEFIADLRSTLTKTSETECLASVSFTDAQDQTECYGPQLYFENHPDGASSSNQLPSGDVGIWSSTNGTQSEACLAAKMNNSINVAGATVNSNLKLLAGMLCVASVKGEALPAAGKSIDLAETLTTNITGSNFTTAKLERLEDKDGLPTYKVSVVGQVASGKNVSTELTHSAKDGSTEDFKGKLTGSYTYTDTLSKSTVTKAYSVVYGAASGKVAYEFKSASFDPSRGTGTAKLVDSDNLVTFGSESNWNSNAYYGLMEISQTTGLGSIYWAWQAGNNDSHTRVFQATTSNSSGTDSGYGYFGFGPTISAATVGTITGMICNWAGPSNNHNMTGTTNLAQAQKFARDSSSGVFKVSEEYISYAPTNNCNNASATFKIGTSSGSLTNVTNPLTNNLVAPTFFGSIPAITAPEY